MSSAQHSVLSFIFKVEFIHCNLLFTCALRKCDAKYLVRNQNTIIQNHTKYLNLTLILIINLHSIITKLYVATNQNVELSLFGNRHA